jgi:hypothetical protein
MTKNSANVQARLDAEELFKLMDEKPQPKRFWEVMKKLVEEKLELRTRRKTNVISRKRPPVKTSNKKKTAGTRRRASSV